MEQYIRSLPVIPVRNLLNVDVSDIELWGNHLLVKYDDKVLIQTRLQVILLWFYLESYRQVSAESITSDIALTKDFTTDTHLDISGKILWAIATPRLESTPEIVWVLSEILYTVTNRIYNYVLTSLGKYAVSSSLIDIAAILNDQRLIDAKTLAKLEYEESGYNEKAATKAILKIYTVLSNILYGEDETGYEYNGIRKLCRAGVVNKGQIYKIFGALGFVRDIDGTPSPYPIFDCFAEGISSVYAAAYESRNAALANQMTDAPLKATEYFLRRMQLAASFITRVDYRAGGCQGYVVVPWQVQADEEKLLKGKYYMVEGSSTPKLIWGSISHLVGQTIQMRSITGCGLENTQHVCKICLGFAAYISTPESNIGFATVTDPCAAVTGAVLGVKHLEPSSASTDIVLGEAESHWLRIDPKNPQDLLLSSGGLKHNYINIAIDAEQAALLGLIYSTDVSELQADRLTTFEIVEIAACDSDGNHQGMSDTLQLAVAGTGVHFSKQLLNHLKENNFSAINGVIQVILPTSTWDPNAPIFCVPRKGEDIMTFFNNLAGNLDPTKKGTEPITGYTTRAAALSALVNCFKQRFADKINMPMIEIFVRAAMCSTDGFNRLPHPREPFVFKGMKTVPGIRDIACMTAFEGHAIHFHRLHWKEAPPMEHIYSHMLGLQ